MSCCNVGTCADAWHFPGSDKFCHQCPKAQGAQALAIRPRILTIGPRTAAIGSLLWCAVRARLSPGRRDCRTAQPPHAAPCGKLRPKTGALLARHLRMHQTSMPSQGSWAERCALTVTLVRCVPPTTKFDARLDGASSRALSGSPEASTTGAALGTQYTKPRRRPVLRHSLPLLGSLGARRTRQSTQRCCMLVILYGQCYRIQFDS